MNSSLTTKSPKYAAVAQSLREQIRRGQLRPGDRLPSYAEMKAQGVSQPTLDRVHALLERDGLIEKRHGSGVFVARPEASAVRQGVVGLLGLEAESWAHPYWAHLLAGARRACHEVDLDVMLLSSNAPIRWERMDALLVGGYGGADLAAQRPEMMPAAGLMIEFTGMNTVNSDDGGAIHAAVDHLAGLGHRRIAYLHSGPNERTAAYCEALTRWGVEARPEWSRRFLEGAARPGWTFVGYGRAAMQQWLGENWKFLGCTALLCHNDEVALGAMRALKEAELRVPQDVSVVGFDGTELAAHSEPSLATLAVPLEDIGRRGVELLLNEMSGVGDGPVSEKMPVLFRSGESTGTAQDFKTNS